MEAQHGLWETGSSYGGWIITRDVDPSWICYCIGIGADVTLERELLALGATVRSVDPIQGFVDYANGEIGGEPNFAARVAAVAASDGPISMQVSHDPQSDSVSSADLYDSHNYKQLPGLTLRTLMDGFGDSRIDLLKLDVEGAEYDLIPTVDLRALGVRVFATQLHHNGSVRDARKLIEHIRGQGYRYVGCRPAVKLTFVAV